MRRVVITGMGAICGVGESVPGIWATIVHGTAPRIRLTPEIYDFDPSAQPRTYTSGKALIDTVCGVSKTDAEMAAVLGLKPNERDRHQFFAEWAAREAMWSAGLDWISENRAGCIVGTGDGGLRESESAYADIAAGKKLSPRSNLKELPNVFAGYLTQKYGLRGPNYVHVTACAASLHAIQHAADMIRLDRADLMLAGGADASISRFGIASFASQRALANECRPFHKDRQGFLMGEGAAMLVLEERDCALERGAKILAEIVGYGATADGVRGGLITDPSPQGGVRAAEEAFRMARLEPNRVTLVKTHGTGTPTGDAAEIEGIRTWMTKYGADPFVTAPKSFHGHLLGAAGALETVLTVKMMSEDCILPTRLLDEEGLDPACGGVRHVMHTPMHMPIDHVLINGFGFGGTNATLILKKA